MTNCRNLKFIFVNGGVKRKLNYMGHGVDKKVTTKRGDILIYGTALS